MRAVDAQCPEPKTGEPMRRFFLLLPILLLLLATFAAPPVPAADAKTGDGAQQAEHGAPSDPLDAIWRGQYEMLEDIQKRASDLSKELGGYAANLTERIAIYDEDARRLIVLANNFTNWANPMEAVNRRIISITAQIKRILKPLEENRSLGQNLLERISFIAENLPADLNDSRQSADLQRYSREVKNARSRLTDVIARYDTALAPHKALLQRLEQTQQENAAKLPTLWKSYYLQGPVPWLSSDAWTDFARRAQIIFQGMRLRLPVEIPSSTDQWRTACLRFLICLLLSGILILIGRRRWLKKDASPVMQHIFNVSLPWLCLGFAFLGSSFAATGEFFRFFLSLSNLCFITGQMLLAWDLRNLAYGAAPAQRAPFLRLLPLTFAAYVLLYLPLLRAMLVTIWTGALIISLFLHRRRSALNISPLQMEAAVIDINGVILWICLFLAIAGLYVCSMGLYLFFVSVSLALELSLGGIAKISEINENLPKEGAKAALASLLIALAAPLVLIVAVISVLLWVGTLPGGIYLLQEYVFQGISIGATNFNLLQILMIVSVFFLTRATVIMGSRFLAKLPQQISSIDATLIPPMQTALTYAAWAIFGLFVLKSLGMELSNLAMVAGGLSVGIGFGMQTIVNNFLSGLILIFSRMLQAGDVVEVGGVTGRVRKINVRDTTLETYDNALIYVPNSEFISSRLVNWTRNNPSVRGKVSVGVAYDSDTGLVMKLLLGIANAHENVLKYPTPSVTFSDFGASTLDFTLFFWVHEFGATVKTASEIRLAIEKTFRANNIEIAFPQMDLHVKGLPPRAKTPQPAAPAKRPLRRIRRLSLPPCENPHES